MRKKITIVVGLTLFSLVGCNKDLPNQSKEGGSSEVFANFVSANEAEEIAASIRFEEGMDSEHDGVVLKKNMYVNKVIEHITKIPDENGEIVYYIINYKNNGFIILSADRRINPVLAFSESSNFPMDLALYPDGIVDWLENTKNCIRDIRLKKVSQTSELKEAWQPSSIQQVLNNNEPIEEFPPNDGDCQNEIKIVGPLLTTSWNQVNGYNALVPLECGNEKAPAGCVAIAMAQVMKYHRFPNTYNWDAMANHYATMETAKLIRDIGNAVDMKYGCDGSGAKTKKEVASSLVHDFGYSNAKYADYNYDMVKQQINSKQPVILRGGRKKGWWIFGTYADGHAWVCDGYKSVLIYDKRCIGYGSLYLHMNWGWQREELNGWYSVSNWNPDNSTYNYGRGMVYDIKP